jgi:hypothetical protein
LVSVGIMLFLVFEMQRVQMQLFGPKSLPSIQ